MNILIKSFKEGVLGGVFGEALAGRLEDGLGADYNCTGW